jgi:hypothetical protein
MDLRTRYATILAFGAIIGLSIIGCRSDATGTTKTNEGNKAGETGAQDNSFRLGDLERVELKQGGAKEFKVSIHRGAGFRSEVKFSLRPPTTPQGIKGITFTPADWMLNADESSGTVTAKAEPDATVGTFSWTLIVRPRVGKEVTHTLTVVVSPKG